MRQVRSWPRQVHRSREQIEDELLAFELTERRVFLGLTIVFALMSTASYFFGAHWPVPAGSGLGAFLSGLGVHFRRSDGHSR
jgi:hypothetical protein